MWLLWIHGDCVPSQHITSVQDIRGAALKALPVGTGEIAVVHWRSMLKMFCRAHRHHAVLVVRDRTDIAAHQRSYKSTKPNTICSELGI